MVSNMIQCLDSYLFMIPSSKVIMSVLVFVHYYVNHQGLPLQKIEGCYCQTLIKGNFVKLKLQCCTNIFIVIKSLKNDLDIKEIQLLIDLISTG